MSGVPRLPKTQLSTPEMAKRIVCTTGFCSGSPRIDGTRLTCADIVLALYYMLSLSEYLNVYRYLDEDDIRACLAYCSDQTCLRDRPDHFCCGCTLDTRPEQPPSRFLATAEEFAEYCRSPEPETGYVYLGSKEDYLKYEHPEDLWKLAAQCLANLSSCPMARRS